MYQILFKSSLKTSIGPGIRIRYDISQMCHNKKWINSLPAFGLFFPFDVLFDGFDEELNAEFDLTPAA